MRAWTHEKRTASSVCSCTFEKPTPIPTESEKNIACTMCQCSQRT